MKECLEESECTIEIDDRRFNKLMYGGNVLSITYGVAGSGFNGTLFLLQPQNSKAFVQKLMLESHEGCATACK